MCKHLLYAQLETRLFMIISVYMFIFLWGALFIYLFICDQLLNYWFLLWRLWIKSVEASSRRLNNFIFQLRGLMLQHANVKATIIVWPRYHKYSHSGCYNGKNMWHHPLHKNTQLLVCRQRTVAACFLKFNVNTRLLFWMSCSTSSVNTHTHTHSCVTQRGDCCLYRSVVLSLLVATKTKASRLMSITHPLPLIILIWVSYIISVCRYDGVRVCVCVQALWQSKERVKQSFPLPNIHLSPCEKSQMCTNTCLTSMLFYYFYFTLNVGADGGG